LDGIDIRDQPESGLGLAERNDSFRLDATEQLAIEPDSPLIPPACASTPTKAIPSRINWT
jgi:hypothetical protein